MKISPINSNISFTSRNKVIREADAVERKTRAEFPILSVTYIDTFYKASKPNSPYMKKMVARRNYLAKKITAMRKTLKNNNEFNSDYSASSGNDTLYAADLEGIKRLKLGNCEENATAALAVLYANGYYNSEKTDLCYKISFINKETGKEEYSDLYPYDHVFVLTDMNRGGKKDIVIDPWLGFADSISGAIARYKKIYDDTPRKDAVNLSKTLFRLQKHVDANEIDKNYLLKIDTVFDSRDKYVTDYQKKKLGEYARKTFSGILLDTHA